MRRVISMLLAALLLAGLHCLLRAADGALPPARVLYHEDFAGGTVGRTPEGFTDACTIARDDGETYLAFRPGKSNYVYRTPDRTQGGSKQWMNYELDLRLRFPDGARPTLYTIVREGGSRPDAAFLYDYVPLSPDTCEAYPHGMKNSPPRVTVRWADAGVAPLLPGAWHRVVIRLAKGTVTILREERGTLVRVYEEELPPGGGGFNMLSYGPVDLKEITAREIGEAEIAAAPTGLKVVNGLNVALSLSRLQYDVPADAVEVTARLRSGRGQPGLTMTLGWNDGTSGDVLIHAAPATMQRTVKVGTETKEETVFLPDACLEFQEWRIRSYVRPNPANYPQKMAEDRAKQWDSLPAASAAILPLMLRADGHGLEYWIDGRYAGRIDTAARLKTLAFRLPAGAAVSAPRFGRRSDAGRYLPLDITRMNHPGAFTAAVTSLNRGRIQVNGIPLVTDGRANADLGPAKEYTGGGWETDPYLRRSAFDAMPEYLHFSVPPAQYTRAWVLCALDNDPTTDPVLTARLTRFTRGGRGDAFADTTLWLPRNGDRPAPGISRVGSIALAVAGKPRYLPLWLVEIPLKTGEIQDLLDDDTLGILPDARYLDFELLGKLDSVYAQNDRSHKPDGKSTSAVHVFGVTLERSPVEMDVRPAQAGNIYQGSEKAEMTVKLRPREAGTYLVRWQLRDVEGRPAGKGEKRVTLPAGGAGQTIAIPLATGNTGWYGIDISLLDNRGRLLLTHPAACALLPADTRTAGYESPYGTWWFDGAHHGTADATQIGPLLLKAGLRKANISSGKGNTESSLAPWKLTLFQVPWMGRLFTGVDLETGKKRYEEAVRKYLDDFPHANAALIFHESYGGDSIPAELRDAVPAPLEKEQAGDIRRLEEIATAVTEVLRKFPNLKIVFGNCNSSPDLLARFFRNRYPREAIDYLGIEAAGQTFLPEKLTEYGTQAGWVLRETGRKFGHEIPLTACYEWLYRTQRDLGPQRLAEWYARDGLIAHAYRFPHISLALIHDAGNCYFTSLWGGSGLCRRYPLLYPKPAYVAYATLTRLLDRVELKRRVPTGSLTVYALEFTRGNAWVYALWTPRGQAAVRVQFAGDATVTVTDLYGRQRQAATRNRILPVQAGTGVLYLVSSRPVERIVAGTRTFPQDRPPIAPAIVSTMEALADWEIVPGKDERLDWPDGGNLPLRAAGKFALTEVTDPERGKCLELRPLREGALPDIVNEYTVLKLTKPVTLPGKPTTLGVWVKGNSSWGRLMWEFRDAKGESWLCSGPHGWGCDSLDWAGLLSINFDGWCFLSYPIVAQSPVKVISVGGVDAQWVTRGGDHKVDYPITVTGLTVEMPRKALDLTEMVPYQAGIRLQGLSAY